MRRRIGTIVKALLALAVLGYLIYFVKPSEIAAAAAEADVAWLLAALALLPAALLVESTTWYLMVRRVEHSVRWRTAAGSYLAGQALALFTPARAGAYVGRALYFPPGNRWEIGAIAVAQTLFNMTPALTVGSGLLFFALYRGLLPSALWWYGIAAAGAAVATFLLALLMQPRSTYRAISHLVRSPRFATHIGFLQRLERRHSIGFLCLSLAHYAIFTSQLLCLVAAFHPSIPLGTVYVGIGIVFLAKNLLPSVTLTDLGVREGAAVLVLGQLGVSGASALSASLLLYGINLVLAALLGIPFVLRLRGGERRQPALALEPATE